MRMMERGRLRGDRIEHRVYVLLEDVLKYTAAEEVGQWELE